MTSECDSPSSVSEQQPATSRMAKRWGFGVAFFLAVLALVFGISFMAAGRKRSDRPLATGDNNVTYADNSSSSRYPSIQQQPLGGAPLPSVYGRGYNVRKSEVDLKGLPGQDQAGRGIDKDNYKQIEFGAFMQNKLEASSLETRMDRRSQPGGYETYKGGRSEGPYQRRMQILHGSMDTVYGRDKEEEYTGREDVRGDPEIGSQKNTEEKWYGAGTQDGKYNAGQEEAVVTSKAHDSAGADSMAVRANSGKTVCNTADCEYMRWIVNASVDTRKNPCGNFYEYACGMANKAFENDASMVKGGMLRIITKRLRDTVEEALSHGYLGRTSNQTGFEKVAALYAACQNESETLDESDRNAVVNFLTDHHMLPTENLTFDPLDKQIELMFEGFELIFKLSALPVILTKDVKFLLRLPQELYALLWGPTDSFEKRRNTYEEAFKDIFPATTFNETTFLNEFLIAEQDIITILKFNYREDMRLIPMTHLGVVFNDKGLADRWITALEKYTNSRLPARYSLEATEGDIRFVHNLFGSGAKISIDLVRKFLAWRAMVLIYRNSNHVAHRTTKQCLHETVMNFPFVALSAAIFQTEGITKEKVSAVQQMTQNILDEIGTTLSKSPWLDWQTRLDAQHKSASVSRVVGFPLGLWSSQAIDVYMTDVPDVGKSFLASTIEVVKAISKRNWDIVLSDKSFSAVLDLFVSTIGRMYQAKATYIRDYNALVISPAAIAKPVFINGGPPEVNYGALGRLVSAQIMRAFDKTGQKYGATGQPVDWFTKDSKMAYAEKVRCHRERLTASPLARRYGDHPEYLTDIMSAHTLLRAYRIASERSSVTLGDVKGLTSEQLFYVSWCLLWCGKDMPGKPPLEGRCNLPLMNSEDFSEAFRCSAGAAMNAEKKCHFW